MHVAEGLVSTLKVAIATPSLVRLEAKEIAKIHAGLNEYSRFWWKQSYLLIYSLHRPRRLNVHVAEGLVLTLKVSIATTSLVKHESKEITRYTLV